MSVRRAPASRGRLRRRARSAGCRRRRVGAPWATEPSARDRPRRCERRGGPRRCHRRACGRALGRGRGRGWRAGRLGRGLRRVGRSAGVLGPRSADEAPSGGGRVAQVRRRRARVLSVGCGAVTPTLARFDPVHAAVHEHEDAGADPREHQNRPEHHAGRGLRRRSLRAVRTSVLGRLATTCASPAASSAGGGGSEGSEGSVTSFGSASGGGGAGQAAPGARPCARSARTTRRRPPSRRARSRTPSPRPRRSARRAPSRGSEARRARARAVRSREPRRSAALAASAPSRRPRRRSAPPKGGCPVMSSYKTAPSAQMSARSSALQAARSCSGAM